MRTNWNELLFVGGAGSVGGMSAWLFGLIAGYDSKLSQWALIAASIPLGFVAAVVFVFVLANTERKDKLRLLGVGFLAGFCWKPVLEAGTALVASQAEQARVQSAKEVIAQSKELLKSRSASESLDEEAARRLVENLAKLGSQLGRFETVRGRSEVESGARELIVSLERVGDRALSSDLRRDLALAQIGLRGVMLNGVSLDKFGASYPAEPPPESGDSAEGRSEVEYPAAAPPESGDSAEGRSEVE